MKDNLNLKTIPFTKDGKKMYMVNKTGLSEETIGKALKMAFEYYDSKIEKETKNYYSKLKDARDTLYNTIKTYIKDLGNNEIYFNFIEENIDKDEENE